MLISDEYRALNAELHRRNELYGTTGEHWAPALAQIAASYEAKSILDYGCGKGTLAPKLPGFDVREYDPAVPGKDEPPQQADMVYCGDVLEHVEPECLNAVLNDLRRLTLKATMMIVATRPAEKTLADGRNAHLIVKPSRWWLRHILDRWDIDSFKAINSDMFLCVAVPG